MGTTGFHTFSHALSHPTRPWQEGAVRPPPDSTQGLLMSSWPEGLRDKAKLDHAAGHGPGTSTHCINHFVRTSTVPGSTGPRRCWCVGSCADRQAARTPLLSGALALTYQH